MARYQRRAYEVHAEQYRKGKTVPEGVNFERMAGTLSCHPVVDTEIGTLVLTDGWFVVIDHVGNKTIMPDVSFYALYELIEDEP